MSEWRSSSRKRKDRAGKQRQAERAHTEEQAQHLGAIAESPIFQRVLVAQRKSVGDILRQNSDHQGVVAAAVDTLSVSDYLAREHLKVLPPEHAPACREGCHHCCYLRVQASVPEVFLLAQWLQARREAGDFELLRAKLRTASADPRVLSLTDKPKQRIPCVLLEDGACSAYAGRPLACRGFTSTDAELCRRSLDDNGPVSADAFLLRVYNGAGQGLARAFADAGLGSEIVELTRALDIVLNEPNVFERWSAGEAVFERARVDRA